MYTFRYILRAIGVVLTLILIVWLITYFFPAAGIRIKRIYNIVTGTVSGWFRALVRLIRNWNTITFVSFV